MIYRTAPFSMNGPYPQFQGHDILWRWIPRKRYEIQIVSIILFNEILIGTYIRHTQQCHFEWSWVILSDLAKYSMTWSAARSLCDSWASCLIRFAVKLLIKPQLAIAILRLHASELSICLSVCPSVARMQKTLFSQKLSNLELWCLLTTYRKSHMGISKNPSRDP